MKYIQNNTYFKQRPFLKFTIRPKSYLLEKPLYLVEKLNPQQEFR